MVRSERRVGRMLARVLACVVLGAMVTIGVSALCAWKSRLGLGLSWPETTFKAGEAWWGVTTWRSMGAERVMSGYLSSVQDNPGLGTSSEFGWPRPKVQEATSAVIASSVRRTAEGIGRWHHTGLSRDGLEQRLRMERYVDEAAGWPFLALCDEARVVDTSVGTGIQELNGGVEGPWTMQPTGGTILPARMLNSDRLIGFPMRPVWMAFLANIAVYGMVAYALLFGPPR